MEANEIQEMMQRRVEVKPERGRTRRPGEYTPRERWLRTMHFQTVDRVPHIEFGYWEETLPTWHKQGLPSEVKDEATANAFFGFDPLEIAPVNVGLFPLFPTQVLEEDEHYRIIVDGEGVTCKVHRDGTSSIPHYLDFGFKSRADWPRYKERLQYTSERFPENWTELVEAWRGRDYPLGLFGGSLFGWIRNWMGFERSTMMFYDDPKLMAEIMDHLTQLFLEVTLRAATEVDFDFVLFWEDMAYNHGPMISPAMFKEYLVPRYREITGALRRRGIDIFMVDCDGNINAIVEHFLAGGVNCMFPVEVAGGTDPVALRQRFGEEVLLRGGVDKVKLAQGKKEIDAELARLAPVVAQGGFVPHVDHRCPPDVPYENYLYYLEQKKKILG